MINEFAVRNTDYNNEKNNSLDKLKTIGNESLFYFALFLSTFFILNSIPFTNDLLNEFNLGINEVLVSSLGFANIFFFKFYKTFLQK